MWLRHFLIIHPKTNFPFPSHHSAHVTAVKHSSSITSSNSLLHFRCKSSFQSQLSSRHVLADLLAVTFACKKKYFAMFFFFFFLSLFLTHSFSILVKRLFFQLIFTLREGNTRLLMVGW